VIQVRQEVNWRCGGRKWGGEESSTGGNRLGRKVKVRAAGAQSATGLEECLLIEQMNE
jgi:hypothetical protein